MNFLKLIKKNLFIQNIFSRIFSNFPADLEFTLNKYQAIRKALYITAHDKTLGSYVEFGVFTGSSFNFAMKVNKRIEKIFGKQIVNLLVLIPLRVLEKLKKKMKTQNLKTILFL